MTANNNEVATLKAELAEEKEKAKHWEQTCHAQWETSSTIEADNNTLSKENTKLRDEMQDLQDRLKNGIKYDEGHNQYLVIWTARQLKQVRKDADEICAKLNIGAALSEDI